MLRVRRAALPGVLLVLAMVPSSLAAPSSSSTTAEAPTGRTFYMAPGGSDRADGSLKAPRRTLLAASRLLRPGDTLLVRGGTYQDPGGYDWATSASGTSDRPIVVKAYPGETPTFDGRMKVHQGLIIYRVAYVTFEGLTFTRFVPYSNGLLIIGDSSHIALRGIRSYGSTGIGPGDSTSDHHIYIVGSDDVLIEDCTLEGIQGAGVHVYNVVGVERPSSNVTVRDSHISDNGLAGILTERLSGGTIERNVLDGNGAGLDISYTSGMTVSGNLIEGSVGIRIRGTGFAGAPIDEHDNSIDAPRPFVVVGSALTLAQWKASGRGTGDAVG